MIFPLHYFFLKVSYKLGWCRVTHFCAWCVNLAQMLTGDEPFLKEGSCEMHAGVQGGRAGLSSCLLENGYYPYGDTIHCIKWCPVSKEGWAEAGINPPHSPAQLSLLVKSYQELVVAEELQRWRCVVVLYILASAQCSCDVASQAVTSSGCNFQRSASDLGVWAFGKGIKKTDDLATLSVQTT